MPDLKGVPGTLFIPLAGRIYVSERFPEYFYDGKSLELKKELPDGTIGRKSNQYQMMASVARYRIMDEKIRRFIAGHGEVNIVNLGCGLDTTRYRIADESAVFYEVDFPEVIENRRRVLGESETEVLLGYSILDMAWTEHTDTARPTLMLASGVFQYMHEDDILKLMSDAGRVFSECEIVFDYTNSVGLNYANRYVRKTGNRDAEMYFCIDDETGFAKKAGAELLSHQTFFTETRKIVRKGLNLYTRIAMRVVDKKKRACVLHLGLSKRRRG